jgi:hypothetical protein
MRTVLTRGTTHRFGKPENWDADVGGAECGDLLVRAELFGDTRVVQLTSTWKPSDAELAHLNRGGVIECHLLTPTQPPMMLSVVDPTDDILVDDRPEKLTTINEDAHGLGYDEHGSATP